MVTNIAETYPEVSNMLMDKLPEVLSEKQKNAKIKNLLYSMKTKDFTVDTVGDNTRNIRWILDKQSAKIE